MISPKKIHEWFMKALEEPFFRAEMHRAEILLQNSRNRGCKRKKGSSLNEDHQENGQVTTLSGKIFSP
ncbi:MAG: hypothetical protein AB1652_01890 [Bacillota bacterium]